MRLVHLSDLHLGHRPFLRAERGGDLRERDLAETFQAALREVVRIAPDLVILSGDLFHDPDPPSTALLSLTRGLRQLQDQLPHATVVAIAGERDTPITRGDPGPLAILDAIPGVEAAAGAPRALRLNALDAHVMLVPHRAVINPPYPDLRPDPGARWNVLVIRGYPEMGDSQTTGEAGFALDPTGWDYVAIGGSHAQQSWRHSVHAAGALERVGLNPWREVAAEKGILMMDLATGERRFHPVSLRPVVELAAVRVDPDDLEVGTRRLRDLLQEVPGGIAGKLVRVRLRGDVLCATEGVSPALLQGIRAQASHVEVLVETPRAPAPSALEWPRADEARPRLRWRAHGTLGGDRTEATPLSPGLWCVTVAGMEDLARASAALAHVADPTGDADGAESGLTFRLEGWTRHEPEGGHVPPLSGQGRSSDHGAAEEARRWADWVEASGEAEVCAMEWARSRQEAESRLQGYRDRARELRERIQLLRTQGASARCPICRQSLEEAHPGLLTLLEEEWEDVVQDGTWWKRRREQLEEKPDALRMLEQRALELQPAREPEADAGDPELGGEGYALPAGPALRRDSLRRAGFLLQRATRGILWGLVERPGNSDEGRLLHVVEWSGRTRAPDPGEAALLELALAWALGEEDPQSLVHPILSAAATIAPPDAVIRLLESGLEGGANLCRLVLVPPAVARKLGGVARAILEIWTDEAGRNQVRILPGGGARLLLPEGRIDFTHPLDDIAAP